VGVLSEKPTTKKGNIIVASSRGPSINKATGRPVFHIGGGGAAAQRAEPTAADMARGFGVAMKRWAASGVKLVSKKEHTERYSICQACEYFQKKRCKKCGCFMYTKTKLAGQVCPATPPKWGVK